MPRNSKGDLITLKLDCRKWRIDVMATDPARVETVATVLAGHAVISFRDRETAWYCAGLLAAELQLTPTPPSGNSPACETEKAPNGNPGGV